MKTNKDYTLNFKVANSDYGKITVPKGTSVTNKTACGIDENYHFVDEYGWIAEKYPEIQHVLKHDVYYHGINIPKEYIEK